MSIPSQSPGVTWAGMSLPTVAPIGDPDWFVVVDNIVGWWDGLSETGQSTAVEHWSGMGALETEPRYTARVVEIVGSIVAKPGNMVAAWDAIRTRRRGVLRVDENDMGVAKLGDAVKSDFRPAHISEQLSRFSLYLRLADPLRYGAGTRALPNGVNLIPNAGDESAFPTLTLTGPHDAVTIDHPGGSFMIDPLAVGTWVFDFRNGDAWTTAGARVFGVTSGSQPVVDPGGSSWSVSGLGAGSATLSRFEAWT